MGVLITISQIGSLITSFLLPSIEAALKIKALFNLDPSYEVNVFNLSGAAITADDKALVDINAWRASKGLPPEPGTIPALPAGTAVSIPVLLMGPPPVVPAAEPAAPRPQLVPPAVPDPPKPAA